MKIAFVVGFFDPVRKALEDRYPDNDRLVVIPAGRYALVAFKERFQDIVKTAESAWVCVGRSESQQHIEDDAKSIIAAAQAKYTIAIQFKALKNLYESAPVLEFLQAFEGLDAESPIEVDDIRTKVTDGKILCVSLEGKTRLFSALQRAGVSHEALRECFIEDIIKPGKNSNLMQYLEQRARRYTCLLYAWDGLRSSPPEVKAAYRFECHEAVNAFQVAEKFKKWIMEGD